MTIEPKSIETILKELELHAATQAAKYGVAVAYNKAWLRSAIASAILHAAEAVKPGLDDYGYDMATPEGILAAASHVASANAYYAALSTYAEKIMKE